MLETPSAFIELNKTGTAVVIAGLSGVRHLRKLVSQQRHRVVQLRQGDYRFD